MLNLMKKVLFLLGGAVILMLVVCCVLSWKIRFVNARLLPEPEMYVYDDGARRWLVQVYHRPGTSLIAAYVNPSIGPEALEHAAFTPPRWSALRTPPTFEKGFHYDYGYGWPLCALAWSGEDSIDGDQARRITVNRGIVVVQDPADRTSLIVLPTRPIWGGILTNLCFYVPVCWVLAGLCRVTRRWFLSSRSDDTDLGGNGEDRTEVPGPARTTPDTKPDSA
ncbi:MAG: hypothetical protein D8M59_15685 [Planctomycetes bacterium]|nr:hypothetical protein [Planctomycetota bacterium]NOG54900.1 hypothetical protein [Planctomycetota bacterium]